MVRRFQPWAALLLTTAALACAAPQPAATPTTAALPTLDPGRVRFDEGGFSLTLPQGWSVAGPFATQVDGAAYSLYALGIDPGASGGPGTSQIIVAEAAQLTAEAFAAAQCTTCPTSPFVDVQLGGPPGAADPDRRGRSAVCRGVDFRRARGEADRLFDPGPGDAGDPRGRLAVGAVRRGRDALNPAAPA